MDIKNKNVGRNIAKAKKEARDTAPKVTVKPQSAGKVYKKGVEYGIKKGDSKKA